MSPTAPSITSESAMSGQRECPSCASMVSDDEERCLICGYEFPTIARGRNWRGWVAIVLLLIFVYPLIRFIINLLR